MKECFDHRALEFRKPDIIRAAQEILLKEQIGHISGNSPYYGKLFSDQTIDPSSINLASLSTVPFTGKSDLEVHNEDFFAVSPSRVVDTVLSSGTTGKPTQVIYTEHDLRRLAYNEELSFLSCGLSADDTVLLTCTMDRCFVAGLAYFLGLRNIGATAIRNGVSSFSSHLGIIRRMKPGVIIGVPSFLRKLALFIQSEGVDPKGLGIKKLICVGEPLRDRELGLLKLSEQVEELWGAKAFSTYASSETVTTFCECTAQNGGHLHPELAVAEIVSEEGEVLPSGETGEVVITPLCLEGMPLLRFKTGDISFLIDEPCACGRNSQRLGPILGRKKQMIKYRGTTLYPQAIYAVMDGIPAVNEYYVVITSDYDLSDIVRVYVSVNDSSLSSADVGDRLQAQLRVRPEVVILSDEEVRKQVCSAKSRKLIRFIDMRENNEVP
ncbi:MAG: AMP-binding protein [Pseudomonadota bacterium]